MTSNTSRKLATFLDVVEKHLIRSNVVLVSFIPDRLSHEDFLVLMEAILMKLLGDTGVNARVLRFLRLPQGAAYFADQPLRWIDLYHPECKLPPSTRPEGIHLRANGGFW